MLSRTLRRAAVMLTLAGSLRAQVVIGSVVLPDSATPVAGAIVTASDPRGVIVGRVLTSQRGEFILRLTAPESVRLRVLRIGYWPATGPVVNVASGATERVRIIATANAVVLAAVGVRERETCRVSADTGLAVARVWEEARKAMLTSQLSADNAPLFAEWIEYDRTLDSTSRLVREQHVRTRRHPTTHAFRSAPAEMLREQGYVIAEGGATTYHAPDADVLLSDAFVEGHCFRLVASPANGPDLVGVGFVPTRERRDLREIEGTLWVDRASSELRTLEFRYLNLPDAAEPAHAGGLVEFRRLADGNWFVSRWNVRMPRLGPRDRSSDNGLRRTIMSATTAVLRAVQVTGGEVTRALRGDSVVFQATGPVITVQIVARDSTIDAAGATLALDGTDYTGAADASGRIRLSPVLAGRYRASVRTPLMARLGVPALVRELETHADARVDSLLLPTMIDALASACPRDSIRAGEGMLLGRVRDERNQAIGGVVVTATWASAFSVVGMRDGDHLTYSERTLQARSDDAGTWKICGVPRDVVPTLTVATDSGSDRRRVRMDDRLLVEVDLVLHQPRAETRELDALKAPVKRALVEIAVTDDRGARLAAATLEVQPANGPSRTVVTGASGTALVPDVALGALIVRARHVGFTPGQVALNVASGRVVVPIVMSGASMPILDTMRVIGARVTGSRLDAFEQRRLNRLATVSITREEIEKRNPVDTWQMLTNIASVTVAVRDYKVVATSKRAMISRFDNEPCFLRVMVDGILLNTGVTQADFDLRQLPHPDEIHGIEVFSGPASIPLEYGGTGTGKWCGLIAIWTR